MSDNKNQQPNIKYVRDLLSPYMDGEVTDEERALVEQAITDSAALNQELATLHQTVALISALPSVPAPRPFTLSEADSFSVKPAPKKINGLWLWVGGVSTLVVALLFMFMVGNLFGGFQADIETASIANLAEAPSAPPTFKIDEQQIEAESAAEDIVGEMDGNIRPDGEADISSSQLMPTVSVPKQLSGDNDTVGLPISPVAKPEKSRNEQKEIIPTKIEIKKHRLQIKPGIIRLAGKINAKKGTVLLAILRRNEQPFNEWAEPDSLQTVVQAAGYFSFTIRGKKERADNDLSTTGEALYQVAISSADNSGISYFFFNMYNRATPSSSSGESQPVTTRNNTNLLIFIGLFIIGLLGWFIITRLRR